MRFYCLFNPGNMMSAGSDLRPAKVGNSRQLASSMVSGSVEHNSDLTNLRQLPRNLYEKTAPGHLSRGKANRGWRGEGKRGGERRGTGRRGEKRPAYYQILGRHLVHCKRLG